MNVIKKNNDSFNSIREVGRNHPHGNIKKINLYIFITYIKLI